MFQYLLTFKKDEDFFPLKENILLTAEEHVSTFIFEAGKNKTVNYIIINATMWQRELCFP